MQSACSGKEPALAKSLLWHLLKTLCLKHTLDTKMTQIIYEQQSRDTDNFFRCMLSLLYSFGLFVCGFFFYNVSFFVFFFLLVLSLLGSLFRFFSPPFCLLVYFILFWLFFVLSFVLFCFWFCFLFSFLSH